MKTPTHDVLIVTYYWPPGGGPGVQRYLKFTKYLPRFQVRPLVLTVSNPTYPIRDESLLDEVPPDLKVFRTRTVEPFSLYAGLQGKGAESVSPATELKGDSPLSRAGSWIRANLFIPDARVGWVPGARRKALEIVEEHGIDTVITTGPPHSVHFVGRHLQKEAGTRWFADFRDPWSGIYYNQLLPRTTAANHMDRKLENLVLSEADEVIVVSRSQAENFRKIHERGYRVIPNGFDPEDFPASDAGQRAQNRPLLMRHIGTIGEAAIPETLLHLLKRHEKTLPIRLEFIGEVHRGLPRLIERLQLGHRVTFTPYLPHRQAVEKMCSADLLLLSLPDVPQIDHHLPGKLFEYLGSGRPILMLGPTEGEAATVLNQMNAGVAAPFRDSESIREALEALIVQEAVQSETEESALPGSEEGVQPESEKTAPPDTEESTPPDTEETGQPDTAESAPPDTEETGQPDTVRKAPATGGAGYDRENHPYSRVKLTQELARLIREQE